MFTAIASNIIIGWLWRRVQEVGGLLTIVITVYSAMPVDKQAVVVAILTGQGGGLSIAAGFGFLVYAFSQVQSYRSTTKPQIVAGNQQVPIKDLPILTREQVKDIVQAETGVRPEIIEKPTR